MSGIGPPPATMRVARLHAWGDVRVQDAPVPRPGPGEVVIRVDACGLCGSDALRWYVERKAPTVLGHEPVGVVVEAGPGVSAVAPGDRVFVHHHAPCLSCAECRRGLWSNCATWQATNLDPGGFAEYARVPAPNVERDTLVLPPELDTETATFIEPLACCLRALKRQGGLALGDAVVIVGLGAMGQLMVPLARALGAGAVFGSDFVADRRDLALRRGADAAFEPGDEAAAAVRRATDGRGADVVVVCPGSVGAVRAGIAFAAPGGRVVCFTPLPPGDASALELADLYFREIALLQSYSCGPDETRAALELLAGGVVDVAGIVTHRVGLNGVADALERAAGKGDGMKTIVYPAGVADRQGAGDLATAAVPGAPKRPAESARIDAGSDGGAARGDLHQ